MINKCTPTNLPTTTTETPYKQLKSKHLIKDVIQWDVYSWLTAVNYWDENINWSKIDSCLELGGRKGGLSLWLALKGKNVVCSDLADAQEQAEHLHHTYGVQKLVTYQNIDAMNIPYKNYFDIIIFKSIIGGIGRNNNITNQQKVFDEIYKSLKPGGKLLFAENATGSILHKFARSKFVKWGKSWRYVAPRELEQFLSQFGKKSIKAAGVIAAFGRSEKQRNLLAIIDRFLLNHVCPDRWKYILFGIAEK